MFISGAYRGANNYVHLRIGASFIQPGDLCTTTRSSIVMLHTRQRFLINLPRGSHSKHDTSGRTSGSSGWRGQYGHAWRLLPRILLATLARLALSASSVLSLHTCPQEGNQRQWSCCEHADTFRFGGLRGAMASIVSRRQASVVSRVRSDYYDCRDLAL